MRSHMLAAAVALVVSVGCGSASGGGHGTPTPSSATTAGSWASAPVSTTPQSTTARASTLPAPLVGRWARVFTTKDWAHAGGYPAGKWTVEVSRNGQVSVFLPNTTAPDFVASFEVTGSNLSIGNVPVCGGSSARYRWSATSTALTIVVVSDTCGARAVLFGQVWQRQR